MLVSRVAKVVDQAIRMRKRLRHRREERRSFECTTRRPDIGRTGVGSARARAMPSPPRCNGCLMGWAVKRSEVFPGSLFYCDFVFCTLTASVDAAGFVNQPNHVKPSVVASRPRSCDTTLFGELGGKEKDELFGSLPKNGTNAEIPQNAEFQMTQKSRGGN